MTLAVFHVQKNMELDVDAYLRRRYEGQIANIQIVEKEDLDMVCVTKSWLLVSANVEWKFTHAWEWL